MSRDWTPRETRAVERDNIATGRLPRFLDLEIRDMSGTPMMSAEETAFRKEYPLLGTTFDPLWEFYNSHADQTTRGLIARMERMLTAYENGAEIAEKVPAEWFDGKLDPGFYYRTENNRRFLEYLELRYQTSVEQTKRMLDSSSYIETDRGPWPVWEYLDYVAIANGFDDVEDGLKHHAKFHGYEDVTYESYSEELEKKMKEARNERSGNAKP